jgi:acetylornithine deacetylase/succinyl-diaminopimelate desuccinylase-like protein
MSDNSLLREVDEHIDDNFETYVEDLRRLIAQPSVSATGEGVRECAELLVELLDEYGFDESHIVESPGMPCVISRAYVNHDPDNEYPTMLIYGHFDTQPVDEDAWDNPPFEPTIIDGPDGRPRIHARGSGDNKGNHFAHLCAVRSLRAVDDIPLNIILFLDGEEESGSPHMEQIVTENKHLLEDADREFKTDGSIHESGRPMIKLGSRGLTTVKMSAEGANRDLHSGHFGGSVPNPAWELVRILDSMKDENGYVTIEGFYEDVKEMTEEDKKALEKIPEDDEQVKADLDIDHFIPGPADSHLEGQMYYPTLNIAGFSAGYTGDGFKTVLPHEAKVHIDMRLVVDQDADDIFEKFEQHVENHSSDLVDITVRQEGSRNPNRTPLDSKYIPAVTSAVEEAWGVEPIIYPSSGASGPHDVFEDVLGLQAVGMGYANADERQHSPEETMAIHCFQNGIHTSVRVFANFAKI